jgi:hypothetical protein
VEKFNIAEVVSPSVSGAPHVVEDAAVVVVPSRSVVLGMDGTGRVGSALDVMLCPAKELVATGGYLKTAHDQAKRAH